MRQSVCPNNHCINDLRICGMNPVLISNISCFTRLFYKAVKN